MESNHEHTNTPPPVDTEAAKSRFLDSMGLGENALRGITNLDEQEVEESEMVLSSRPDDLELPGASNDRVSIRVQGTPGMQVSASSGATVQVDRVPVPTPDAENLGLRFSQEPLVEAVAEEPVEANEETTKDDLIHLSCPKCDGELVLRHEHLGVDGACVWCEAPIVASASGADGEIKVFPVFQPGLPKSNRPVQSEAEVAEEITPAEEPVETKDETTVAAIPETGWGDPSPEMSSPSQVTDIDVPSGFTDEKIEFQATEAFAEPIGAPAPAPAPAPDSESVNSGFEAAGPAGWSGDSEAVPTTDSISNGFSETPAVAPDEAPPTDFMAPTGFETPDVTSAGFSDVPSISRFDSPSAEQQASELEQPPVEEAEVKPSSAAAVGWGQPESVTPPASAPAPEEPSADPLTTEVAIVEAPPAMGMAQATEFSPGPDPSFSNGEPAALTDAFTGMPPAMIETASHDDEPAPFTESSSGFSEVPPMMPAANDDEPSAFGAVDSTPASEMSISVPAASGFAIAEVSTPEATFGTMAPATIVEEAPHASNGFGPASTESQSSGIDAAPFGISEELPVPVDNTEPPVPQFESNVNTTAPAPAPESELTTATSEESAGSMFSTGSSASASFLSSGNDSGASMFGGPNAEPSGLVNEAEVPVETTGSSTVIDAPVEVVTPRADEPQAAEAPTPNVISQPLGAKPKRKVRTGFVVMMVVILGLVCGAALASYVLPVDEYVVSVRALMEQKFNPAGLVEAAPVVPQVPAMLEESIPPLPLEASPILDSADVSQP